MWSKDIEKTHTTVQPTVPCFETYELLSESVKIVSINKVGGDVVPMKYLCALESSSEGAKRICWWNKAFLFSPGVYVWDHVWGHVGLISGLMSVSHFRGPNQAHVRGLCRGNHVWDTRPGLMFGPMSVANSIGYVLGHVDGHCPQSITGLMFRAPVLPVAIEYPDVKCHGI